MVSPYNCGTLVGGLVNDPETVNIKSGKIFKFRVAVDRAGQEGGQTESGYFDVTYFAFDNDTNPNTTFVRNQIEKGNLKKGSQVHMIYRLNHERWESDGSKKSRVSLIAEAIEYARSERKDPENNDTFEVKEEVSLPASW